MGFFDIFKVILFGIVEGLTEWIPVSNTAHLAVLGHYVNFETYNASAMFRELLVASAALGAVTAAALLFLPGNSLVIIKSGQGKSVSRARIMFWCVATVSFLPTLLIGLVFADDFAEFSFAPASFRNLKMTVVAMVVGGILYIVSELRNRRVSWLYETTEEIPYRVLLLAGLTQTVSFIPGTSRFGILILTLTALGARRACAVSAAVFLSIPSLFLSALWPILHHIGSASGMQVSFMLAAFIAAFFTSFFMLREIVRRLSRIELTRFGRYRIGFGILLLFFCIM